MSSFDLLLASMREVLVELLCGEQTLAVAGAQGGDEGKGKIIAFLAWLFDIVERYGGGSNAGHTAFTADGKKIVSHLIPCGLAAGKNCIIGRGVMFDLCRFATEYKEALEVLGADRMPPILIDSQCTVWTPWHPLLESWIESKRLANTGGSINTTGRGIGPLAAIRALRIDIKVGDLVGSRDELVRKLDLIYDVFAPIFGVLEEEGASIPTPCDVADQLRAQADVLADKVVDAGFETRKALQNGFKILFEAAQSTMLDLFAGTNPFVSSGMSTAAGAAYGSVVPPRFVNRVLLVAKFLPTRVGEGPLVSEIGNRKAAEDFPKAHPELFKVGSVRDEFLARILQKINAGEASRAEESQYFQVKGLEVGASTGRGRSPGYCDMPMLRYAKEVNGSKYLALTWLDMMSGLERIPIVVDYMLPTGRIMAPGFMPTTDVLYQTKPVIDHMPGWSENIYGCNREEDLPAAVVAVIQRLELETGMRVVLAGTGGENDAIIVRKL